MQKLNNTFYAAGQILPEQVGNIAAQGFDIIINNRPDGEEPGQPSAQDIAVAAGAAGIDYVHIPVGAGGLSHEDLALFNARTADKQKALGFCKSGFRSVMVRAMALAQSGEDVATLVAEAGSAGYDISAQQQMLQSLKNG
ncbi:TIGR01244 family sulfur transferase [Parvularcula sp. IMCC14364]|uniref:TIGR01244 family sulfur transferase n=1 Tax=Parvularcula sp. IMCC14364 TaxID=3067902 RepID=UPI002741B9C3|nr:TIGR01244 family sulfur transferase [Parvularcula sp. IMCC14364]